MLKPIASFAVVGIIGLVVAKLLGLLILPVIGFFLGLFFTVLKVAFIIGLVWLGFWLFQRMTQRPSES